MQAHLHDRELPEPGGAEPVAAAPPGADRAGPRVRHAHPGRRRLRRAALRRRDAAAALRAGSRRPGAPRRHPLADPGRGRAAGLAERAVEARIQYTPGPVFYANGGGEDYIRLAFSYEQPDKCYEGARMLAKAMLSA